MGQQEALKWLEDNLNNYPDSKSGENLYRFFMQIVNPIINSSDATDKSDLVDALKEWIKLKSEPRTMLAVEIAASYNLIDLKSDLKILLDDINQGKVFSKYYNKTIEKALQKIG